MSLAQNATPKLVHSIPEVARLLNVSDLTIFRLLSAGKLYALKIGARTVVTHTELLRFIAEAPAAKINIADAPRTEFPKRIGRPPGPGIKASRPKAPVTKKAQAEANAKLAQSENEP
jgi:excisionase family DNA binding protein